VSRTKLSNFAAADNPRIASLARGQKLLATEEVED
jgi:hypothetical protein